MTQVLLHLVILVFLIGLSKEKGVPNEAIKKWQDFKVQFGKIYESPEVEDKHLSHFVDNLKLIEYHNKREKREVLGLTQFADQSSQTVPGCTASVVIDDDSRMDVDVPPEIKVNDTIDWRKEGYVTPVQNQDKPNKCGSCWAFSTIGAIEGYVAKKKKRKAVKLSEQNLVDCSETPPNDGCKEGNPLSALRDIVADGGVATYQSYTYNGQKEMCRFSEAQIGAKITGYEVIKKDEQELKEAVFMYGPISVTIDSTTLKLYKPGTVFNITNCTWQIDSGGKVISELHSVLVVGYGTDENGTDYWLIKNSWGTTWGDKGYFKLARNNGNQCGIANQAVYPLLKGTGSCRLANGYTAGSSCSRPVSVGIRCQCNGFFFFLMASYILMVLSNSYT